MSPPVTPADVLEADRLVGAAGLWGRLPESGAEKLKGMIAVRLAELRRLRAAVARLPVSYQDAITDFLAGGG